MPEKIKFLKFPFQFDIKKLEHDLSLIIEQKWIAHFNTYGYDGDWKVIPLYAKDGNESNIFALSPTKTDILETPLLKKCHYFKSVIDSFKCNILSARILRLGVNAEIKPHRDFELGYEDGCFRLHIPIITNTAVQFILDNNLLQMLPGECWYTNVNYVHSVKNLGTIDRVHLVIDGERNKWSDDLFASMGYDFDSEKKEVEKSYDNQTIHLMIKELEQHGTETSNNLIKKLKLDLIKNKKK